jgi:hypothetical protein
MPQRQERRTRPPCQPSWEPFCFFLDVLADLQGLLFFGLTIPLLETYPNLKTITRFLLLFAGWRNCLGSIRAQQSINTLRRLLCGFKSHGLIIHSGTAHVCHRPSAPFKIQPPGRVQTSSSAAVSTSGTPSYCAGRYFIWNALKEARVASSS